MARDDWDSRPSRRSYWPGVLVRLIILGIAVAGVLAIGQSRYGWRPFGTKITARQLRENLGEAPPSTTPKDMDALLKEAVGPDKSGAANATPEPTTTTTTMTSVTTTTAKTSTTMKTTTTVKPTTTKPTTTTTVPKPSDLTDQDQKALDDLLKQESD